MDALIMLNRKTVQVGDVFQILTSEGVCYGQVINTHHKYKFVVAIFREFFPKKPKDFTEVVSKEPQFITIFLIQDAVRQGLFSLVANVPVADHLKKFPIFRGTNNLKANDTIWFFWDGERQWREQRPLTEEEKNILKVLLCQVLPC
jgi:hypothetical protein